MAQENGIHLFSEFFRHLSYHAKNMLLRGKEHARIQPCAMKVLRFLESKKALFCNFESSGSVSGNFKNPIFLKS